MAFLRGRWPDGQAFAPHRDEADIRWISRAVNEVKPSRSNALASETLARRTAIRVSTRSRAAKCRLQLVDQVFGSDQLERRFNGEVRSLHNIEHMFDTLPIPTDKFKGIAAEI